MLKSFRDLEVYQNLYQAGLAVIREVIPALPAMERYDLSDQLRRAAKAAPRLVAEGYAKKHQKFGFQKYLDDAMGECNECIVCLEQARDLYKVSDLTCKDLVMIYDKSVRQLYRLSVAWTQFKLRSRQP
ncbi:MAG: four helix bundle protein [Patescibacteria group bacterium]|jgi:four helix bundle protein